MHLSRRSFLCRAAGYTAAFALWRRLDASPPPRSSRGGYGPLIPDPAGILDLPQGFRYRLLSQYGETMSDGLLVPNCHDGACAFPGPGGTTLLVRNHELLPFSPIDGPFGEKNQRLQKLAPTAFYDYGFGTSPALGGTTTLVCDSRTGDLLRHSLSLAGTVRNCAGGPTPWGSWLSCEEFVQSADQQWFEKDHGFVFEVPARADGLAAPVPLSGLGRMNHEACAVDVDGRCVYLTEDRDDGLLYRFVPDRPGQLAAGGRLQALKLKDLPWADTRNWGARVIQPGRRYPVEWVEIHDVLAPGDDLRVQGHAKGAALFARGEGIWAALDGIYFTCTSGGAAQIGQVFRYRPPGLDPDAAGGPEDLELWLEPNDYRVFESVDNLAAAPWGALFVCEDGTASNRVLGLEDGGTFEFARNAFNGSELAGVTFSPDGSTMFVNRLMPGATFAIRGPWR
jgi:secreted PhoX family phosphatase